MAKIVLSLRAFRSYDLNKSHFHNVLETASKDGAKLNVNFLILTTPETDQAVVDQKKDVALYAMTYVKETRDFL